jgi:hypothetical protein
MGCRIASGVDRVHENPSRDRTGRIKERDHWDAIVMPGCERAERTDIRAELHDGVVARAGRIEFELHRRGSW